METSRTLWISFVEQWVYLFPLLFVSHLVSDAVFFPSAQAFNLLLGLHVLFNPATDLTPVEKRDNIYSVPEELKLTLDEQVQWRCAGFMQAEIEKFAEEKLDLTASQQTDGSDDEDEDDDEDAPKKKKKGGKKKKEEESEYRVFASTLSRPSNSLD